MGEKGKYEIREYEIGKYGHLATFFKSCQCHNVGNQLILKIWC